MSSISRWLALAVICSALAAGCGQRSGDDPQRARPYPGPMTEAPPIKQPLGEPAATLAAPALWNDYGENALQADSKYKGKTLKVTGSVRTVQPDESGRYYVGFTVFEATAVPKGRFAQMTEKEKTWLSEGYPPLVICYLDQAAQSKFARIKKDEQIGILGRCVGRKKDPSGFKDYIIVLEDCQAANDGQ